MITNIKTKSGEGISPLARNDLLVEGLRTDKLLEFNGCYVEVPEKTPAEMAMITGLGMNATAKWFLSTHNYYKDAMSVNYRQRQAGEVHEAIEPLCHEIETEGRVPRTILDPKMGLSQLGLSIILAFALENAGYERDHISKLISNVIITNYRNLIPIWNSRTQTPGEDFTHIPTALSQIAYEIINTVLRGTKPVRLMSGDSPFDELGRQCLREIGISDYTKPFSQDDWNIIYHYLLQKLDKGEIVFAKFPTMQEDGEITTLTSAILLPTLDGFK